MNEISKYPHNFIPEFPLASKFVRHYNIGSAPRHYTDHLVGFWSTGWESHFNKVWQAVPHFIFLFRPAIKTYDEHFLRLKENFQGKVEMLPLKTADDSRCGPGWVERRPNWLGFTFNKIVGDLKAVAVCNYGAGIEILGSQTGRIWGKIRILFENILVLSLASLIIIIFVYRLLRFILCFVILSVV